MPALQPDKCFKLEKWGNRLSEALYTTIPQDWQQKLMEICCERLNLNEEKKATLFAHLKRHVQSETSTYTYVQDLIDGLQTIYLYMGQADLAEDKKGAMADKIAEGIVGCTGGFHIRVNEILSSFQHPQSMGEFLSKIRYSMIEKLARKYTSDVHTYTRFFTLAQGAGFGVQSFNANDAFAATIRDDAILASIRKLFDKEYHFFWILHSLKAEISSVLCEKHAYTGFKSEGYKVGQYQGMVDFFKNLLQREDLSYESVLQIDDWGKIVNLNWLNIYKELWLLLKREGYVEFTLQEEELLASVFNQSVEFERLKDHSETLGTILADMKQALPFLSVSKTLSWENKKNLLRIYLHKHSIDHIPPHVFLSTLTLWSQNPSESIMSELLSQTDLVNILLNVNDFGQNGLLLAIHQSPELISFILHLFDHYIPEKNRLLQQVNNDGMTVLGCTLLYCPQYFEKVMSAVLTLNREDRIKILKHLDHSDMNLLQACLQLSPNSTPYLLSILDILDGSDQQNMLEQTTVNGWNTPMYAIRAGLRIFEKLDEKLTLLNSNVIYKLLKQQSAYSKHSMLLIAVKQQPECLPQVFKLIRRLDKPKRQEIFSQVDFTGCNALILAARYHPQVIHHIIDELQHANNDFLSSNLLHVASDGGNAFMHAILQSVPAALSLLRAMKHVSIEDRTKILLHGANFNNKTHNALTLAASEKPELVASILDAVFELEYVSISQIFQRFGVDLLKLVFLGNQGHAKDAVLNAFKQLSRADQICIFMGAVVDQPGAVPIVLHVMAGLDDQARAQILSSSVLVDGRIESALILSARNNPLVAKEIINAISRLQPSQARPILLENGATLLRLVHDMNNPARSATISALQVLNRNEQLQVLKGGCSDLYSALNLAANCFPGAFPSLFEEAKSMLQTNRSELRALMTRVDFLDWNLLMDTASTDELNCALVLGTIKHLSKDEQFAILSKTSTYGFNALMLAIRNKKGSNVLNVLLAIKQLEPEQQNLIFRQTATISGLSLFTLTAEYFPEWLPRLLAQIKPHLRAELLTCTDLRGQNALMLAIGTNPSAAAAILLEIERLDEELKAKILTDTLTQDTNPIMFYPLDIQVSILNAIQNFNHQHSIGFIYRLIRSQNTLSFMHAAKEFPELIDWILQTIQPLTRIEKRDILRDLNEDDLLTNAATYCSEETQVQISQLLSMSTEHDEAALTLASISLPQKRSHQATTASTALHETTTASSSAARFFSAHPQQGRVSPEVVEEDVSLGRLSPEANEEDSFVKNKRRRT